jgi:hypothetical protein
MGTASVDGTGGRRSPLAQLEGDPMSSIATLLMAALSICTGPLGLLGLWLLTAV